MRTFMFKTRNISANGVEFKIEFSNDQICQIVLIVLNIHVLITNS